MKTGDTTRHLISKGRKTREVVYKTFEGRINGRPIYSSRTRHYLNSLPEEAEKFEYKLKQL